MTIVEVAGEPVDVLLEASCRVELTRTRSGLASFPCELEPRVALPFLRAIMRIEAELLVLDADALTDPGAEPRTQTQRALDA